MARLALLAGIDTLRQTLRGDGQALRRLLALSALAPFAVFLPLVTAAVYADEQIFAWRHYRRFAGEAARRAGTPPPLLGAPAAGTSHP